MNAAQLFGQRLRAVRKARKLSIAALSSWIGVCDTYVGFIERGERNVTVEMADRLARSLGVPLGRLLNPGIPMSALLDPCGNCGDRPPIGYRCLSCGLQTTLKEAA
jgi:transcriptional regulator with XRE-family HTH domain